MKRIKVKSIILAVGLLVCSFGGSFRAFAEDTKSTMVVSPMTQKLILLPGESTTASISVSNPNDATRELEYSLHIGSFSQIKDDESIDDYGTVDTDSVSNYNLMMNWITLPRETGTVAPNETDTVHFTIDVPQDAPAGGQYATIIVKDETKTADAGSGNVTIQSITQVASIIYAEVAGETRDEGKILENDVPGLVLSNPLTTTSMVENSGNVHTNAKYILQVWPLIGDEEICTNEENPAEGLVMPETKKYHKEECNLPPFGVFRVRQTVRIFGEESIVEKMVILCPIWLLFVFVFAIIVVVFWLVMRAKNRKK